MNMIGTASSSAIDVTCNATPPRLARPNRPARNDRDLFESAAACPSPPARARTRASRTLVGARRPSPRAGRPRGDAATARARGGQALEGHEATQRHVGRRIVVIFLSGALDYEEPAPPARPRWRSFARRPCASGCRRTSARCPTAGHVHGHHLGGEVVEGCRRVFRREATGETLRHPFHDESHQPQDGSEREDAPPPPASDVSAARRSTPPVPRRPRARTPAGPGSPYRAARCPTPRPDRRSSRSSRK